MPVAAILVASIWLHAIDTVLHTRYQGPVDLACDAHYRKGEEMGWFQHGSTIIVFAPRNYRLLKNLNLSDRINMGEPLFESVH
jgi:phosphatidylserine decarboxylase